MFLDVDGSILCAPEHADNEATVTRQIVQEVKQHNIAGFVTPSTKTFQIETKIWWRTVVADFFKAHNNKIQVVWLTGWKHNAHLLDKIFHLTQTSVLDWKVTPPDESGKKVALMRWLKENPVDSFIWIDDVATISVTQKDFTIPHLILTPNEDFALADNEISQIQNFLFNRSHA